MQLPWPCNRETSRHQIKPPLINRKSHLARFEKHDLDSLIAMFIESPILCAESVPKPDAVQARQNIWRKFRARIMSFREGVHFDLSLPNGAILWLASVNCIRLAARLINRIEPGLFHGPSISFPTRIC